MVQTISDMFGKYLQDNPSDADELKAMVREALNNAGRANPGAPVTASLVDSLVQSIISSMNHDDHDDYDDYDEYDDRPGYEAPRFPGFNEPAVEAMAIPFRPMRRRSNRPHFGPRRRWRFPPHFGPSGNDLIRFLLLRELLGG